MSFAEQILESVQDQSAQFPGMRVTRVRLRTGELLAIEPASLRFCLEGISQDTVMEGAAIDIIEEADMAPEIIIEEIELDE